MKKTKAIANDIAGNTQIQKTLFKVLSGALLLLSIIYIYIIGSITFNVVARRSLEAEVRTLGSSISNLELTYLSDMNDVSKTRAESLGFKDAKSNIFATRSITHVAIR